jgi:hypothetical protein
MTVVYHVETHRNPRQVEHLVRTIVEGAPDALVVVDHDSRFPSPDRTVLEGLGVVLRLSEGGYGDLSHVRRWLATARWLQDEGIGFEWLSNLTGQDYPVRSVAAIHTDLAKSEVDAFIQTFPVLDAQQTRWSVAQGRTRYEFGHRRVRRLSPRSQRLLRPLQAVNLAQPWLRLSTAYGLTVGVSRESPWGADVVLRGGSYFTTLRRPAVEAVLRFVDSRPDVMTYLERCLAPEEVFFQTALGWVTAHDPEYRSLVVQNDCRRFFDFSQTELNHPRTLTEADLPTVLGSGADFARKFDEAATPGLLDTIDELLSAAPASAAG